MADDESPVQTDEEHRDWAREHLVYEVNTLTYAMLEVRKLKDDAESPQMAFAIESWAVHVRCLDEFLWVDRRAKPGDARAIDFCKPGEWEVKRGEVPPTLQQIRDDKRIGREIVHLTYHRASIRPEAKAWLIGKATVEILEGLNRFADTAKPEQLTDETRERLRTLYGKYGSQAAGVRAATGMATGATMAPEVPIIDTTGGTLNYPPPEDDKPRR